MDLEEKEEKTMASDDWLRDRRLSRRALLRVSLVGLGTAALAGCSPATQAPKPAAPTSPPNTAAPAGAVPAAGQKAFTFRAGHVEAIGSPMNDAFDRWFKLLDEKSGGALKGQNFPAGQLGSYIQLIESNRMGAIEVSTGGPDTEGDLVPLAAVPNLGYLVKDEQHADKVFQGAIGDRISEAVKAKTGVEFIAWGEEGFRQIVTKRPVQSLADMKGLKIRVPEASISIRVFQLLGANPTPVPTAEIYNALQSGVVDSTEGSVFSILGYKWYEPAPNLTLSYQWFNAKPIRVNAKWLASLPADLQTILKDTAKSVFAEQRTASRKQFNEAVDKIGASGAKVYKVDLEPWRKACEPQYDEYAKQFPETAATIKEILSLR